MKTVFKILGYTYIIFLLHVQFAPAQSNLPQKENQAWRTFQSTEQLPAHQLAQQKADLQLAAHDELLLQSTETDELGFQHYRYQQMYKGIPVENAIFMMHEKNARVQHANGKIMRGVDLSTSPAVNETTALQAALQKVNAVEYAWNDPDHENNLKTIRKQQDATFYPEGELVIIDTNSGQNVANFHLAYKFDIYATIPLTRQIVYIDAHTGTPLKSVEKIHNCTDVPAVGTTNYSGTRNFTACFANNVFTLKNNIGGGMQVFNANSATVNPQIPVTSTSSSFVNDPVATEVHWATQQTYEYFLNTHNRNSLDNAGMLLESWVHYGINHTQAFWNGSWMTYGDGDNITYSSFSSPDIVAHEMTHGIIDFSADLEYHGESGALNESFADIFGEVIESTIRPGGNDWIFMGDVVIDNSKNGVRNLSNPNDPAMIRQQPDTYLGNYWNTGFADNGGVHTNSGVQNYWFYLLSEGGSGINDNGDAYSIEGIGMTKAAAIAYRNLNVYLTPISQYADARAGAIQAATDLYGVDSEEVQQTESAWCAVGVGLCPSMALACRGKDSLALVAFHNSADINWDLSQPMDTWFGITLDDGGCVTKIDLSDGSNCGTLPPELGNLTYLTNLSLDENCFTGNIPPELGNLAYLTNLALSENQLSGTIPPELGNLSNLARLKLGSNTLSGNIPPELGNLSNLVNLDFGNNQLTGSIPPELGNLNELLYLELRDNDLSGNLPPELGSLSNLTYLWLQGNQLSGELPGELSNLINLTYLWASNNQLTGTIPAEFSELQNLIILLLDNNQLSGCYDVGLAELCPQLSSININEGNNFDATWEAFCAQQEGACYVPCRQTDSLTLVSFYNATNNVTWDLTQPMDNWSNVTLNEEGCVIELDFNEASVTGNIPPELGSLTQLEVMDFGQAALYGSIPPELGNLSNLTRLNLGENQLEGNIPVELTNLPNLTYLNLCSNDLTGNIPPELGQLDKLETLFLLDNQLTGGIPAEFANLDSLTSLKLSNNQLSGCYPDELMELCSTLYSYTDNGDISNNNNFDATWEDFCSTGLGSCTPNIFCRQNDSLALVTLYSVTDGANWPITWDLTQPMDNWSGVSLNENGCVTVLDLGEFGISGTIPRVLGSLSQLTYLNLSYNQLSGNIPDEFGQLDNLVALYLQDNQLSGNLPAEIGDMDKLRILWVADNQLNGCYDANLLELPNQLYPLFSNDAYISEGNNFDASWTAFSGSFTGGLCGPSCRQNDSLTLVTLYNSTSGINWDIAQPLDTWSGVTLNETGCVTHLFLSDEGISGYLPPELGNLSELEDLDFNENGLSGIIPAELGNLSNLQELDLGDNEFIGNIPLELSQLTELTYLNLCENNLTGNIPPELGNLSNLNQFYLRDNLLTGSIPVELTNIDSLLYFSIAYNQLSGCYDPGLLNWCTDSLLTLNSSHINDGNNFDASWEEFCNTGLGICGVCQTTDSLSLVALYDATDGANWTHTWDLNQPMDTWYGVTLNESGCVKELSLHYNELNGTIPAELGSLYNLEVLKLSAAQLTGSIPVELSNLTNLSHLDLHYNQLDGAIPPELGSLSKLTFLDLHSNELTGNIPITVCDLNALTDLRLYDNQLSGNIPVQMGNLINLTYLDLRNNQLSGTIPIEFGNLNNLEYLILRSNQLTGDIPAALGNLDKLTYLALQTNQLTGDIPAELGGLSSLVYLNLGSNQLTGNIPVALSSLGNLTDLELYYNNLTGAIPPEFGNMANLETLYLFHNQLTGNIPEELGDLDRLIDLRLQDNQLSGCYNSNLANLCAFTANNVISNGNSFDVSWELFCNTGAGNCTPVWPGDFNNDGTVSNEDVLYWGLAASNIGTPRPEANTSWTAQECPSWQVAVNDVNGKHQDGDGNGQVNVQDIQVLLDNYGKTRLISPSNTTDSPLSFRLIPVSSVPDNGIVTTTYELYAEASSGNAVSTHGIAFSIDFGNLSVRSATLDVENSALQPNVHIDIFDPAKNRLDIAMTRTDKNNQLSEDAIASVIVAVEDLQAGDLSIVNTQGGNIMSAGGEISPVNGSSLYSIYSGVGTGTVLSLSATVTHEQCNALGTAIVQATGAAPYTYLWSNGATSPEVTDLTSGIYTVTVTDAIGLTASLSIQVDGQLPIYDLAGNLICGSTCPDFLTPDSNGIPSGTYQAGKVLKSDSAIPTAQTVEFKAGEIITLDKGFSIQPGSSFSAEIEDCGGG